MFGYVKPAAAMSEEAQRVYKAVYCSLCESLRGFGFGAKLLLNYDFAFAALLLMSCGDEASKPHDAPCNTYPFRKVPMVEDDNIKNCAAALIIVSEHKFADDMADEGLFRKIGAAFMRLLTKKAYRNAKDRLPGFDEKIREFMAEQSALERERCDSFDRAADPSARGLGYLLGELMQNDELKPLFSRLGYLLGRFVYLADAADDLESDLKRGRYNPAIPRFSLKRGDNCEDPKESIRELLRQTAANIELCFRLVPVKRYEEILGSIIYTGLDRTARTVGTKQERKTK